MKNRIHSPVATSVILDSIFDCPCHRRHHVGDAINDHAGTAYLNLATAAFQAGFCERVHVEIALRALIVAAYALMRSTGAVVPRDQFEAQMRELFDRTMSKPDKFIDAPDSFFPQP